MSHGGCFIPTNMLKCTEKRELIRKASFDNSCFFLTRPLSNEAFLLNRGIFYRNENKNMNIDCICDRLITIR